MIFFWCGASSSLRPFLLHTLPWATTIRPDPDNEIPWVIAIFLTFSIVACVAAALGFYVRMWVKKSVWVDDFAALSSALLGMAYAGLAVARLHAEYFPICNDVPFSKLHHAGGPGAGGFGLSYKIIILAAIAACVFNQLAFAFVLSFGCHPVSKQWDPSIPGSCINTVATYCGLAGTSLGFDVIIIALPLPILARLQPKLRQKSIIIWSDIEISLGVIISCIPTYDPFFRALAVNISSYRRHPRQASEPSYGQSFRLSSQPVKSSHQVFDNSVPTTGMVTNTSRTRVGDNESQESVFADRDSEGQTQTQIQIKTMGGIHIKTQVKVEIEPRCSVEF
ncbi:hypothetical protein BJX63DRAFT_422415 [Aspergillus granulosus]|uniref:Rhodopsin domain-containing protein n=1 Tax=Aspergillus granulosus TaxID=176169 RepID=A0ABR4H7Q0_9EURO